VNLGELSLDHHGNASVKAYTDLQSFGMIVTAEPYFAVTQPGNMVVMESAPLSGAAGENIDARYELVTRGTYSSTNTHIQDAIFGIDSKTPLELFEARNAVRIAHIAAADKYAASILSKAGQQLMHAEEVYRQKQNKAAVEAAAKEATETAEEARLMAVKQKAEDEAQAAAAAREAKARADAEAEAKRRANAEAAQAQAEQARAAAEQSRAEAVQAQAEAERMKQEALAAAQEAAQQKEEAEKAKADAIAQQQLLAAETDKAKAAAAQSETLRQQAENEKQELRARLLQQLNSILATRDSARGLVANMSDVLFRSGSYELLPAARERLAKVSGIVLAYPSLHVAVEGHTDSVGSDLYNQDLSEHRAQSVRDYFVQQGISSGAIEARGFGKTEPIATNDTPEGRQANRRVELVLSGDAIGNTFEDAAPAATAQNK
jgi:outer membrane protein OmpA-like peptidoglycan-associated protein